MTIKTYRQALHDTLRDEMLRDENVFLMGEEIGVFEGSYKITAGLLAEFGDKRVKDTPIAEEGFTGAAIGAAMLGLRPVVEIMTINFSLLALDQIVNHAAKIYGMFGGQAKVPLVIRTPGGGGQQLGATHSQNIEIYYAFVPGMKVVAPSTPADAKALLLAAIRDDDPVLFLENLALYNTKGEVPDDNTPAEIGKAKITREGHDLTLIGYSRMAYIAKNVAETLAESEGLDIEVIDLMSLRPLDRGGPRGRLADLRDRSGDCRDDLRWRIRLPRRTRAPCGDGRSTHALFQGSRIGGHADQRRRRERYIPNARGRRSSPEEGWSKP
jgi:pyruvate dehydrogenase E1 component beta subunit